jgi:hypothetical protein
MHHEGMRFRHTPNLQFSIMLQLSVVVTVFSIAAVDLKDKTFIG